MNAKAKGSHNEWRTIALSTDARLLLFSNAGEPPQSHPPMARPPSGAGCVGN